MRLHWSANGASRAQGCPVTNRHAELSNAALSAKRYALPSLSLPKS